MEPLLAGAKENLGAPVFQPTTEDGSPWSPVEAVLRAMNR
jgi:hypothetical protein